MSKNLQFLSGYFSLFFLLITSIVFGQDNANPLDITVKDYYYETKKGDNKTGEFIFLQKIDSDLGRIVTQPAKTITIFPRTGILNGIKYGTITSEQKNIKNNSGVISPTIEHFLNSNNGKWELINISGNNYFIYNFSNSSYLFFNGTEFGFSKNIPNNTSNYNWEIPETNDHLKNTFFNKFLSYKTITGYDSPLGWGIIKYPVDYTEYFADDELANIHLYKRLRMNGVVDKTVIEGDTEKLFKNSETGGTVVYEIIENKNLAKITGDEIKYNQPGVIKLRAVSKSNGHIPSYSKTITVTIVPRNNIAECFSDQLNEFNTNNSKFSNVPNRGGAILQSGVVKLQDNQAIQSIVLPEVFGNSVTVQIRFAGKHGTRSIRPGIKVSLINENSDFNRGPVVKDVPSSGIYVENNLSLSYSTQEFIFTQVEANSRLLIEVTSGSYIWLDRIEIQCIETETNVWEYGKWSKNHPPTMQDKAIIRDDIDQNITARTLIIEKDLTVPSGRYLNVYRDLEIEGDYTLKFEKGAYLFLDKIATVNKEIEFETKSEFYYWDTRIVSSPVFNKSFNDVFGQNRGLTSSSDYAISEFTLAENVSYGEYNDYVGTFIPSETENFEKGRAYALQRYRLNGKRLDRYGDQGANKTTFINSFIGFPNNEDFDIVVYNPQGEYNYNGSYAVGNPYTAPLSISSFLADNPQVNYIELYKNDNHYNFQTKSYIDNRVFWDVCNSEGTCGANDSKNIDLGVGFIVMYKASNLSAEDYIIKFRHNHIANNLNSTFQNKGNTIEPSYIKIQLNKNNKKIGHPIILGYSNNASEDYDYGYDIEDRYKLEGLKIINKDSSFLMDFKGYPFLNNHKFPLKLDIQENGIYEINAYDVKGIFEDKEVYYLYDRFLNLYVNMKESKNYIFDSNDYDLEKRFEIVFKTDLLDNNEILNKNDFKIFKDNSTLKVDSKKNVVDFKVFDLAGSNYLNKKVNSKQFSITGLNYGVSIIKFQFEDGTILTKKLLK